MKKDKRRPILVKALQKKDGYQTITPADAEWDLLSFTARIIKKSEKWEGNTGDNEYLFVLLGGNFVAETSAITCKTKKGRKNVFSGLPHGLYLPPHTEFCIKPVGDMLDIACGWCPAEKQYPAQLITPEDVATKGIEYRGVNNASRQINSLLPPGSKCSKLVCVEVYTPAGNWSSFPAHKHDTRKTDPVSGALLEARLEELYFYKADKTQGFALQKIYNDDRSLDEIVEAHNNDVVLVPMGYHPVVACYGYNIYYLNFLAGSDQSLASSNDPDHDWIYETWGNIYPRLPVVTIEMNGRKN